MGNVNKFRSKIFKALSVTVRLEILDLLRDEEKCVGDISQHFGIMQSLVSRHLKILRDGGLVKQRREGTRSLYSVTDPRIFELIDAVTLDLVNALSKPAIEQMTV
jgi:DNA-binding transcriptional ArsR family regulator